MDNKAFAIRILEILKGTLIGRVVTLLVTGGLGLVGYAPFFDKYIGALFTSYFPIKVDYPSAYVGGCLIFLGICIAVWNRYLEFNFTNSNNGKEYYDHVNEFEKYLDKLESKFEDVDFQGKRRLYSVLFPEAKTGNFSISESLIDNVKYLIFHLAETELEIDCNYAGRYVPKIDVMTSLKFGLGSDITKVDFTPRAELFITGLYGLFGIIDQDYIKKVHSNYMLDEKHNREILKCYDRLARILSLIIDFSSNNNSSFIPDSYQNLFSLDLKSYKKRIKNFNKKVEVFYFPFGMVYKVVFV